MTDAGRGEDRTHYVFRCNRGLGELDSGRIRRRRENLADYLENAYAAGAFGKQINGRRPAAAVKWREEQGMSPETIFVAGPTGNLGWPPIEAGLESGRNIIAQGWRLERPAGFETYPNFSARQAGVTRQDEIRGVCRGVEVVIKMRYITTQCVMYNDLFLP